MPVGAKKHGTMTQKAKGYKAVAVMKGSKSAKKVGALAGTKRAKYVGALS